MVAALRRIVRIAFCCIAFLLPLQFVSGQDAGFGQLSDASITALVEQARQQEDRQAFREAVMVWDQIVTRLQTQYDEDSWQVTNARLARQVAATQAGFDSQQRAMLQQIGQLQEQAVAAAGSDDLETALQALQEAERLTSGLFGDRSHLLARLQTRRAGLQEHLGRLPEAWQTYRDALAIARPALGVQHPDTEVIYYKLGTMLNRHGHSDRALDYLLQSVNIAEAVYGREHPAFADRLTSAGVALQATGQYQRALEHLLAGDKIQEQTLGAGHRRRGLTLHDIGVTYLSMREAGQATRYLQAAVEILESEAGAADSFTLQSKSRLATALAMAGQHGQAETLLEQVLQGNRVTHGENSLPTAVTSFQLGILKAKRGDYENAETLLRDALRVHTAVAGSDQRAPQRTAAALVQLLEQTGRSAEAGQLRQSLRAMATAATPQNESRSR
jgi:tetratricopeptide (TPR) repeat protein